jgi:hypothetical protein
MEVGFETDVTRGSSFSTLVHFASQRASGTSKQAYFPNRFDIFLQMANLMRDSNSEPNQVWRWDLQLM